MKTILLRAKKLCTWQRMQVAVLLITTLIMVNNSAVLVYADYSPLVSDDNAWSLNDLQSNKGGWAWFNPDLNRCVLGAGGAQTATGPAADLLTKAGLDQQWVNVIVKYAQKSNTDPIAMAALLFWENRGFPAFKSTGWSNDGGVGSGPWQITASTWPTSAGAYPAAADDPDTSTRVAADIVAHYGGVSGYSLGAISQDFSQNANLKTIATLAKNYNAGQGTFRNPGAANWDQSGRVWYSNPGSSWGDSKGSIIDDYVVAMTYLYYQIASGIPITFKDSNSYVQEGVANTDKIKNFAWKPTSGAGSSTAPSASANSGAIPLIVLDPGRAVQSDKNVDAASNVSVYDYENEPEMTDAWNVTGKVKTILETAGYHVLLTKDNEKGTDVNGNPNTDLKQRADVATQHNASLGVSIYTAPGSGSGNNSQNVNIYPVAQQKDASGNITNQGNWRLTFDGKSKQYYTNTTLADTDKKFSDIFQSTRQAALTGQTVRSGSYEQLMGQPETTAVPGGSMQGTVPTTQYFATVPWVYTEQAQDGSGGSLKSSTVDAYVKGIVDGVEKALPLSANNSANGSCNTGTDAGVGQGDIVKTALYYAWDTPGHGKNESDAKPVYQKDMPKYDGAVGEDPYSDCGVFVATVMIASGADPNYVKRGTADQEAYVRAHPELYVQRTKKPGEKTLTTQDISPGDIFLVNGGGQGHTFIYTGSYTGGDGTKYTAAAASLHGHVPQADQVYFSQGGVDFTVWGLKH